ncbi:putative NRPS-like enzyme [Aspergillus stella-maris]|uniref:putative NRPS-like enzyme n=1 Tax=Aspergillus stella-maris TaxID=1810926 RepID=UPI003CCD482E
MASSTTQTPGKRLLANIVDDLALSNPTQKMGVIPSKDGIKTVTARELSDAVHATAWWIEKHIGKATKQETIAYMGANDIRYIIFVLAAHKTGYKPLLPSTRLSDDAYQHLLTVVDCNTFFYTKEKQRRVSEIQGFRQHTAFYEVPLSDDILAAHGSIQYPWNRSYEESEDEMALIIHSSGTTGMPKPVPLTHGFFATIDHNLHLPSPKDRQSTLFNDLGSDHLVLSTTPFFHLMGFLAFTESIFHSVPFVNLPDKPLSVDLLADTIKQTHATAAMLPPSILEDMSQSEIGIETLKSLDCVYFAGAPLAVETGNHLSKYTKIITVLGSSEMGIICSFVPQGEGNWMYFEWNPAYGVKMEDAGEGAYELVIPRREDSHAIHGIFHTFPDISEYHSKDLFVQHPENPNLWRYHGRRDDVIVLSNGEKLNPITLEKIIEGHPKVQRALLIGQSRFQTSLLVQPVWPADGSSIDETAFVNEIWPVVERANQAVPNYGRITKSKIRLASPEKPFKTTPKGTTQRHAVNKDYADEIEAIYSAAEEESDVQAALPSSFDKDNMTSYVRQLVCSLMEREDIKADDDLYSAGLDSLQTIQLARILKAAVSFQEPKAPAITAQHVYSNSTVSRLAQFLVGILTGQSVTETVSRVDRINNMIFKYADSFPQHSPETVQRPQSGPQTVIVTGSTGSLGTYLLNTLVNNSNVKKVYCFNRSDAASRQTSSFKEKGLDASALEDVNKVEFLRVSFGEKHFGLPDNKYRELLSTVTLIIHNAWAVNFNIPLESFEIPHIRGLNEFITFSTASKHNAHLSFVSSVATIGAWTADMGSIVPEKAFETPEPVLEQGYGESKHVAERLCLEASKKSGVPTSIFRVGQVAGPTTEKGLWNKAEWLPSLVATSKALGKVPSKLGGYEIDWVPVDTLAKIMIELLESRTTFTNKEQEKNAFFHPMNPCKTTWSSLVPAVQKEYNIPAVPIEEWIADLNAINAKSPSDEEVQQKPALKLLDFYRGLATGEGMLSAPIDTSKTRASSESLKGLKAIGPELMVNWMKQWDF